MSTDIFRRYLDLLNEATGQAPTDFAPTHFHKNNLGGRIPLMQTPDGGFWWETTDPENPRAGKTVQPWIGNTENRSGTSTGSVDGVFKDGKPVDFPEGVTWKEFAQSAYKSTASSAPGQSGQPPPKEIPNIKPEVVEPNTNVALPSSGTFTNDMALAQVDQVAHAAAVAKAQGDESPVTGDTRCKICGTKQKDHQNLRHAFVASDSTQPTIAATPGVQPGGAAKRGGAPVAPAGQAATPDVSKVTTALTAIEKILDKYKTKLKENINRLTPVDQMKTWRTLMEYREVDEATRKTRRPTKAEIEAYLKNLPPDAPVTAAAPATPAAAPAPAAPPAETPEQKRMRLQRAAQATIDRTATPAAGSLTKAWQGVKGAASKVAVKATLPLAAIPAIYEGYQQIIALPADMPRDQYRASVTKIVARLVEEFGLFWVGAILGAALAGVFSGGNPLGAVAGFLAGGAGGIAASYLLGDSVGEISDQIVDKLYGTGGAGSMTAEEKTIVMQNMAIIQDFVKANPGAVSADLKARIDRVMAAGKAAGVAPGQGGQPPEGKKAAPAVPAMPTTTSTAPAKLNTTLDGIDNLLKKYNFESQEFDSFFDSLTESEQRRFISKNLHLLSESEQMAERRDMLNEAGAWKLGQKGLRWLGRKLYKAGGGASAGGTPVPPAAGRTPRWKPGFKTGVALGVGGTVGGSVVGYFALREILSSLLDTIKDPETAKVITITPEDTAAWIQFNKELEAALPDQATYDALPQDAKDRLSMIAARAEAMDKAIKESRANAQ